MPLITNPGSRQIPSSPFSTPESTEAEMSRAAVPCSTPSTTIRTRPTFSRISIRPSGVQVNAVG